MHSEDSLNDFDADPISLARLAVREVVSIRIENNSP